MVRTRGSVNTSCKETKGKKKVEKVDDDACRVVEPPVVEVEVQKLKKQKKLKRSKGEGSKTPISTKKKGDDEEVLSPMPIRSLPPMSTIHEVTEEVQPKIHNNYLPWVDYTNMRNLDNSRTEVDDRDVDVGGDESKSEIPTEKNVADETISPIVEGGIEDSSCSNANNTTNLSKQNDVPIVDNTLDKSAENPSISVNVEDVGMAFNNSEGMSTNVSSVGNTVTDAGKKPSA
ncbi:hypothetical protein LIER_22832 [Lithospermum erythrorhizon]|uniref:Uncharacterized protein n=1 Tax=Lithospermum erythrorhizon TaxID=34254 RepID=A0AAV3QWT3_LITER